MKKKNVIVIGGDHHNMLGVIRSLKNKKYNIYAIITCDDEYTFCSKSKYLTSFIRIENEKSTILDALNNWPNIKEKAYLIPTSDMAALVIDENIEKLKEKFVLSSINNKENEIVKYMDKNIQYKLFKRLNLNTPYSEVIDLGNYKKMKIPFPCIMKPQVSAKGSKDDIVIVNKKDELELAVKGLIKKGYNKVLVQEFLNIDKEYDVGGCCAKGTTYICGIIEKHNIYPTLRGSTCLGTVSEIKEENEIYKCIEKIFKMIKYNGIFDVELYKVNERIYINEINFRNSAISYGFSFGGANPIESWIKLNSNEKTENKLNKSFRIVEEISEIKLYKEDNINFIELLKSLFGSKCKLYWDIRDPKPLFYKFINSIKRKKRK